MALTSVKAVANETGIGMYFSNLENHDAAYELYLAPGVNTTVDMFVPWADNEEEYLYGKRDTFGHEKGPGHLEVKWYVPTTVPPDPSGDLRYMGIWKSQGYLKFTPTGNYSDGVLVDGNSLEVGDRSLAITAGGSHAYGIKIY